MSLFAQSTGLASRRGQTAALAVLHDGRTNPVDAGVVANLGVAGIDENDLVVLHGGVLIDPVAVEDAQIGVAASDLFFRDGLEVAFEFELVDTLVLGFSKDHTAVVLALATAATDAAADNHVALLGLVAEAVGLVGAVGTVARQNVGALAVFPGAAVVCL